MAVKKLKYSVNGEWRESKGAKYMECYDPSTGEVIAQTPQCTAEEVESAIKLLTEHYPKSEGRVSELIVVRKLGVAASLLVSTASPVFFDETGRLRCASLVITNRSLRDSGLFY